MQLPPPCRCRCRGRRCWLQLVVPCMTGHVFKHEFEDDARAAGAEAAHRPKQPPASPNVVVYACVTPRLATRAAQIMAAILAWLVPAATSTHRGLCYARRL